MEAKCRGGPSIVTRKRDLRLPAAPTRAGISGKKGMRMSLYERIGIDVGRKLVLEDAVEWAAEHKVRYIDIQLDTGDNALGTISGVRGSRIRALCDKHHVTLGLHTASAVNVAEYAPYVGDAVDVYLKAYVDAAVRLGAKW